MALEVGRLLPEEVDEADRIMRLAFGTFLEVPDPASVFGDKDLVRTRRKAGNTEVLAARQDGQLVGSNVLTRWGSLGWFGPMTVRPDLWNRGVASALLKETERTFSRWGVSHRGLFTFADSPKHLALYAKAGYRRGGLTPIFGRSVSPGTAVGQGAEAYSEIGEGGRERALEACRGLTSILYPGLDLAGEIRAVEEQHLGDTLLLKEGSSLAGLAIWQLGAGTEGGSGTAYVKFAAVRPGAGSEKVLDHLLDAVERVGALRGASAIEVGVNERHPRALDVLKARGYASEFKGVLMHAPEAAAYHREDLLVLDDWR